jgi:vacuolar-type H+-ATPase subunit I/STV1
MQFKQLIFFIALLMGLSVQVQAQPQRQFLHTPEDFYIHTRNHVNNQQKLGKTLLAILKENPQKWARILEAYEVVRIDERLERLSGLNDELHDLEKLNTNQIFLKEHHLSRPHILNLYDKLGLKVSENYVSSNDATVNNLNQVEKAIKEKFYAEHKIRKIRKFLEFIEKKADYVERSENPVTPEEMGRAAYKESGRAEFLLKDKTLTLQQIELIKLESELSLELEKRYPSVAVRFEVLKEKYNRLIPILKSAGAFKLPLDRFAEFELIEQYEKRFGEIMDLKDKSLVKKFNTFLFHTPEGQNLLIGRVPQSERTRLASHLQNRTKIKKSETIKNTLNLLESAFCERELSLIP